MSEFCSQIDNEIQLCSTAKFILQGLSKESNTYVKTFFFLAMYLRNVQLHYINLYNISYNLDFEYLFIFVSIELVFF